MSCRDAAQQAACLRCKVQSYVVHSPFAFAFFPPSSLPNSSSPLNVSFIQSVLAAAGDYCLTGSGDRCAHLWNPYKPEEPYIASFKGGHSYEVLDLDMYVTFRNHSPFSTLSPFSYRYLTAPVTHPFLSYRSSTADSSKIVTAGRDRIAVLWDVLKGTILFKFRGHQEKINRYVGYMARATIRLA